MDLKDLKDWLRTSPLRIGISTRALFDLEAEHKVFENQGVEAYCKLQLERESQLLDKGAGFEVVQRILALNKPNLKPFVEVIVLSRNSPDLMIRAFRSIEKYGLPIKHGTFTSGRPVAPFVPAWGVDLFLSNETSDVREAVAASVAAARLGQKPASSNGTKGDEVRFAFDGDAVVFSAESDEVYKAKGLQAFFDHEQKHSQKPMAAGPFGNFLKKLSILRAIYLAENGESKVRIAIVTARNAPAHERVIHTLRAWGTPADEAHFVGTNSKAPILQAIGAHIFFDDQEKHVLHASDVVAAGHVPGPHKAEEPVIPAG
jgi:5'-nucleotidase